MKTTYKKPVPIEELIEEYRSGKTQVEIAQRIGVTSAAISYRLKKAGIEIRKNTFSDIAKKRSKANHVKGKNHPCFIDLPMDIIKKQYQDGATTTVLGQMYGVSAITIGRKLRKIGEEIRPSGFGTWATAKDGHKVQSYYELVVDDWLFSHNIEHITQPPLPFGRNTRSDFLVNNIYIEVMGLISSPIYKKKYVKKLALYKAHQLNVLCVFPSHLRDNLSILEQLL